MDMRNSLPFRVSRVSKMVTVHPLKLVLLANQTNKLVQSTNAAYEGVGRDMAVSSVSMELVPEAWQSTTTMPEQSVPEVLRAILPRQGSTTHPHPTYHAHTTSLTAMQGHCISAY